MGPATSEQIESNVKVNRSDEDSLAAQGDEVTRMEIGERDAKERHLNYRASIFLKNKMEVRKEGSPEVQDHGGGDPQNLLISVRKS